MIVTDSGGTVDVTSIAINIFHRRKTKSDIMRLIQIEPFAWQACVTTIRRRRPEKPNSPFAFLIPVFLATDPFFFQMLNIFQPRIVEAIYNFIRSFSNPSSITITSKSRYV